MSLEPTVPIKQECGRPQSRYGRFGKGKKVVLTYKEKVHTGWRREVNLTPGKESTPTRTEEAWLTAQTTTFWRRENFVAPAWNRFLYRLSYRGFRRTSIVSSSVHLRRTARRNE